MRRPAQIPLDLPARSSMARDDLVTGPANALAAEAVDAWPHWPHPVVLITGPPGSGKSHLGAAWSEMSGAVRWPREGREPPVGGAPFAVLVEDVDRGAYDENGLFALLNVARLGGGTVLLTSREARGAVAVSLPDLRSRLRAATTVELRAPDEMLLSGVILKLAADRQIAVDPKVVAYALSRMERSFEAAAEFVRRVDRAALAGKERIGRALVQRILEDMAVESNRSS
ncbi:hypothetical protein D3218_02020 [Aureimonas flava]|uniref:Chromosomal replication initiator protein DnaA domain-containing protein n=1 Tax=Aureimonas flava TaxID=2320271 RepID=A0A3A1WR91_9HYPH|nr:hypothetical protein [Aureimonas flava]RIY03556.1 hypothetical protein D3218_02020 [Aureimonas flava]